MTAARIGITTYQEDASWRGWSRRACLVPVDFVEPVARAGGLPILLPPYGDALAAAEVAAWIDGLLLVGGPDIGDETRRDAWESALLNEALGADLPVLGVCRGMQLMNVVRGGDLIEDLRRDNELLVHQPAGNTFAANDIKLEAGQLPGKVIGDRVQSACYHHQAVATLGASVVPTGWSADGTVEALELIDRHFAVGVQWHPEVGPDSQLFDALVHAALGYRARRGDGRAQC